MNTLFIMILLAVSFLTHLIAPGLFTVDQTAITPTVAEIQATAVTEVPYEVPQGNNPPAVTIQATQTPLPQIPLAANTASTAASPAQVFGDAKINDTFERGSSGFGLSAGLNDDETIRIVALNNKLSLQPKKSNGWVNWRLRPPVVNEGAAEMEFSIITCARGDRTGLVMRAKDYNSGNGYYFSLSCEGTVSILRDSMVLGTADARQAFKNNSGDTNVMSAIAMGNILTLGLNGETLLTVQDDAYSEGFSGFFTSPQGENTLTMDITAFREYYRGE